jgi:hypothetical protein
MVPTASRTESKRGDRDLALCVVPDNCICRFSYESIVQLYPITSAVRKLRISETCKYSSNLTYMMDLYL